MIFVINTCILFAAINIS